MTPEGRTANANEADYVRAGLRRGLALEEAWAPTRNKFGLIGSSDSHTGMSAVEETSFARQEQPRRLSRHARQAGRDRCGQGLDMGAAGFVGAWASGNTRQGIFEAFKRREVYASTGPRITLRFFGGYDFGAADLKAKDLASVGYRKGVPMGGDLAAHPGRKAPTFLIAALRDPQGANLDRVQVVKGWLEATAARASGSTTSRFRMVGRSTATAAARRRSATRCDLATGGYRNDIGAPELHAAWRDPTSIRRSAPSTTPACSRSRRRVTRCSTRSPRQAVAGTPSGRPRSRSARTARRSGIRPSRVMQNGRWRRGSSSTNVLRVSAPGLDRRRALPVRPSPLGKILLSRSHRRELCDPSRLVRARCEVGVQPGALQPDEAAFSEPATVLSQRRSPRFACAYAGSPGSSGAGSCDRRGPAWCDLRSARCAAGCHAHAAPARTPSCGSPCQRRASSAGRASWPGASADGSPPRAR